MTRWTSLLALALLAAGGGPDAWAADVAPVPVEGVEAVGPDQPADPDVAKDAEEATSVSDRARRLAAPAEIATSASESARSGGAPPSVPPPR